jgi:hypothetical protein
LKGLETGSEITWSQRLKLKYDEPLSNVVINFDLCHYTEGAHSRPNESHPSVPCTPGVQAPSYREWRLSRGGGRLTRTADEDTFDAL